MFFSYYFTIFRLASSNLKILDIKFCNEKISQVLLENIPTAIIPIITINMRNINKITVIFKAVTLLRHPIFAPFSIKTTNNSNKYYVNLCHIEHRELCEVEKPQTDFFSESLLVEVEKHSLADVLPVRTSENLVDCHTLSAFELAFVVWEYGENRTEEKYRVEKVVVKF